MSALAASAITTLGLGPLSDGALGVGGPAGPPTSTEGSPTPVTTSTSGTGAQNTGAGAREGWVGQPSTTTSTTSSPSNLPTGPPASAPSPASPVTAPSVAAHPLASPTVVSQRSQRTTAGRRVSRHVTVQRAQPSEGDAKTWKTGAPSAGNNVAPAARLLAAQPAALAAEFAGPTASAQALAYYRIPLFLLPIYKSAAAQYGVPWQILAAINEIETDYGSDLSVSTAGAVGWMQFMPATWTQYGVDALNAGYADPYNPVDAIFAAARYLRAAGASSNLHAAILAYNHSTEYVNSVLLRARLISSYPKAVIETLTGLSDGCLPVRDGQVAWGSRAHLISPWGAIARGTAAGGGRALAAAGVLGGAEEAAARTVLRTAPAPATAARDGQAAAQPLRLIDLMTGRGAMVVAVQDGRVVKVGRSRALGKYVLLRDVYGDMYTYAGLGRIASSYRLPTPPRVAGPSAGALAANHEAPRQVPGAGAQLPITLHVNARPRTGSRGAGRAWHPVSRGASTAVPRTGKLRLFAHPGNPDALALTMRGSARVGAAAHAPGDALPLRAGAIVAKGTVLGRVRTAQGARDGHLRFAIQPAGDLGTVDPRPILRSWSQLAAALHPQGSRGEADLLGATASGVFPLSKGDLERDVLSDPGISVRACDRQEIAFGAIDKRVLALLAFLSRSGLKPTVSELRCGHRQSAASAVPSQYYSGDAVDISAIDGIPIAGHQGPATVTSVAIRTLLTLRGEFVPRQIISLMRFPGASNTLAMPEHWNHIHVGFRPPGVTVPLSSAAVGAGNSTASRQSTLAPLVASGDLGPTQWNQLMLRIAGLPTPTVAVKPSSSAIRASNGQ